MRVVCRLESAGEVPEEVKHSGVVLVYPEGKIWVSRALCFLELIDVPINCFPAGRHLRAVLEFVSVVEALCAFGGVFFSEHAVATQVRANRHGVEAGPKVVHKLQNALEGVVDAGPPLEREDVPVAVVVSVVVGDVVQVVNPAVVSRLEAELPVFLSDGAADDFEVDRCGPVVRLPTGASRVFLLGVEVECGADAAVADGGLAAVGSAPSSSLEIEGLAHAFSLLAGFLSRTI